MHAENHTTPQAQHEIPSNLPDVTASLASPLSIEWPTPLIFIVGWKMRFILTLLCISALLSGCSTQNYWIRPTQEQRTLQAKAAHEFAAYLEDADSAEFLALDPHSRWRKEDQPADLRPKVADWSIEATAPIDDRSLQDLRSAIIAAISEGNPNVTTGCFNPRHGIRARWKGEEIVFVLCFECSGGFVLRGGKRSWFELGGDYQEAFDKVARSLGVSISKA
jgi:hypothetical protein